MKKGFTLIELIASIGAGSIIIVLLVSMFLSYKSNYMKSTRDSRNYFYCTEVLMFIQHEIETSNSVNIYNNSIELNKEDEITKLIYLNNDNSLVIAHKEKGVSKSVNSILNNTDSFKVFRKGKILYISVKSKGGEEYERCFGIEK